VADNSQRTEKPTPRRLQKAREKGDFPAPREFVGAAQFLVFIVAAAAWFPAWMNHAAAAMRVGIRDAFVPVFSAQSLATIIRREAAILIFPLGWLAALLLTATLFFQIVSTNFGVSLQRLAPNFGRLNPAKKLADLPGNNLVQLLQAAIAMPIIGWLSWLIVRDHLPELIRLPLMPVRSITAMAGTLVNDALRRSAFVLIALGVALLARERMKYSARLKMSRNEIRDEVKESEGNPQMKAKIRRIQRDMRRRNMMKEVPTATAVIVNPTHYAVAIRYDQFNMAAPLVVAKGKNYIAARIRQRANEHQIPIIENPPLAQALYKTVDIGQEVPPHLYRAVAEILAYIFRLMGTNRA
jgi:flagellar biosynthetic protein FlhB